MFNVRLNVSPNPKPGNPFTLFDPIPSRFLCMGLVRDRPGPALGLRRAHDVASPTAPARRDAGTLFGE